MSATAPLRRAPLVLAAVLWALAAGCYLGTEALAAGAYPGYSYGSNYISDLGVPQVGSSEGAPGSPLAAAMNAALVTHGVLFAVAAALAARATAGGTGRWVVLGLAVVHGVGNVLVAAFPGGRPAVEGGAAGLHALGAVLAIVGGNAAVVAAGVVLRRRRLARRLGTAGVVVGALGLVCAGVLAAAALGLGAPLLLPDAVWERAAVYPIQLWELMVAAGVLLAVRGRGAQRREVIR